MSFARNLCLSLLLVGPICRPAFAMSESGGAEFFEKKVRPLLAENCYECHSHKAKKLKGGLSMDSREGLLKGGDTGVALVLGEPKKSRVIEAVAYDNPDLQMPPKKKLAPEAIRILEEWVKMGAPWPASSAETIGAKTLAPDEAEKRKKEHWAWQPLRETVPPAVADDSWSQSAPDRFVLQKLREKQLAPAAPAEKRVLIRRAFFDLTGLPPTAVEVERFLADSSPNAFAKVVEDLLSRPQYGERIARAWLDIARYGEDQAHSFEPRLYPQGFRYRDWVVKAFNDDMPYDRFVERQIAADLLQEPDSLEHLPALGFFATGPVYYGDKKMFDQYDDRIDTLSRGFLGLTVACARCHDHKFDPIPTKDYYALAGALASSEYAELPLVPKAVVDAYDSAQSALNARQQELEKIVARAAERGTELAGKDVARYMTAAWKALNQRKIDPMPRFEKIAAEEKLLPYLLERWVGYLDPSRKDRSPFLAAWDEMFAALDTDKDRSGDAKALEQVAKAAESFQNFLQSLAKLKKAQDELASATAALASAKTKDSVPKPALDKAHAALYESLYGADGLLIVQKKQAERVFTADEKAQHEKLKATIADLKKSAPAKYPIAHALRDSAKATDLPVLVRGNPEAPGETVPRHFLSALAGENPAPFKSGSGRLELARAIASDKNPLAARVMVNRIWQQHFGQGLVRTPSNFGLSGERPSHPELLDYLALQFIKSGWSVKSMHRLVMLSSAYQMGSRFDARNASIDSENRLLWRMNRCRLEVEAWRDAMLAVSGNLDTRVGGPSEPLDAAQNRRRTFYAAVSRHDLNPLLRLFDFPDPNVTSDKRSVTTIPLQQLFILNGEFVVRQAKSFALRVCDCLDEEQRVREAFLIAYARAPRDAELALAHRFLAGPAPSGPPEKTLSRWEQYAQALLTANEFMYVD